ncbi:ycf43, partial [Symbiodinium sp. CCMP2456]
ATTAESGSLPTIDVLAKGIQQLQELQAQALAKGTTSTMSTELVKPGTSSLAPLPELKGGCDAALAFQDWLEVSSSVLADVSEASGVWWCSVMDVVNQTYERWLRSTPLERLSVVPQGAEKLSEGRWSRLNARVASMLLAAMSVEMKTEMVAQRLSQSSVQMVYRLHTLFQPGGSAERSEVLRRLQNPRDHLTGDSVEEVLKVVRAWPRLLSRCQAVNMSPPDASVLAKGLMNLTDRYINQSTDAAFRTSMLRTTLRLDGQPTLESVQGYQRHLQAELETMISSSMGSPVPVPKIKAVDGAMQAKARDAGGRGTSSGELCKYFAKASGCRRGDRCTYSHSMSSMDKETRAKKCLRCGSEAHRQRDCTAGKPQSKGAGKDQGGGKPPTTPSTMATVATTSSTASTQADPVQGTPWTIETLIQAAQQVVQGQSTEQSRDQSPEKTRPEMKVLKLRDIRVCSMMETTTALLDSGATHSLRRAASTSEWESAEEVAVQLAGCHQLTMRITSAGTLLMPPRVSSTAMDLPEPQTQTIVPMGKLIETLGYTMVWKPGECVLWSPEGDPVQLQVEGGCPQMMELEALSLIARLEDRKLEQLKNETLTTRDKLGVSAMAMEKHWNHYLYDYVATGSFESGLRAVRDAPFFEDLPGECISGMVPSGGLRNGWDIFKLNGFLTRAQRRKVMGSKRWVVHLFAGDVGHWEVLKLDQGETSVIELDLARCGGHDILRDETWRMLLWGAKTGKVDVVMGGPPGRALQHCKGGDRDAKSLKLIARMMWLFAVAQVGRELNSTGVNKNRDVGFMIEYPEGIPAAMRRDREQRVQQAEEEVQVPGMSPTVASWEETRRFWDQVQRPRWEDYVGHATVNAGVSFWDTRMWKAFQREGPLRTISFDQGAMGGPSRNRTTIGTNMTALVSLDEVRLPEDDPAPLYSDQDHVWAPGLVQAIVVALNFWQRDPRCVPRLHAMSPTQWKQHVKDNHATYRKDCATCVMSRGVGRQHRRVHHPEAYVLTADVAGPLSPGLDSGSKGTMGKNLRYLLVAKYVVPRQFIEQYAGRLPPVGDGADITTGADCPENKGGSSKDLALSEQQDKDMRELFGDPESPDGPRDVVPHVEVVGATGEDYDGKLDVADDDEYQPSEPPDDGEDGCNDPDDAPDPLMQNGDCVPPEMTYLTFAMALPNNKGATVKRALQDAVLYLQSHGLPIYRFHADKGEFFSHGFRNWLRDLGVLGTWSEPSVPQGNGRAEATVRWVKDRTRTLLQSAKLPLRLWPMAAATATAEQRAKVLGWKTHLAAPFGAVVHLRKKAFDKAGPLRRELGLESKWVMGRYVGLSSIVHHGHVVYISATEEEPEKFLHTMHVRPNLVDPGIPQEEFRGEENPKPRRRVPEKMDPERIEMREARVHSADVITQATKGAEQVLEEWTMSRALALVTGLADEGFFGARKFGVYRHGGTVGWLTGLKEFPALTKVLARIVVEVDPEAAFTSILVSHNTTRAMHKDFNNDYHTKNYVVPVACPDSGGELWIELKSGDVVCGPIEKRDVGKQVVYGQLRGLLPGEGFSFGPQRYHEVCRWTGARTVIIAYTPNCLGKLDQCDLEMLHDHGFPVPLSQLPEYYGCSGGLEESPQIAAVITEDSQAKECNEDSDWSLYLDLEPGTVKIADALKNDFGGPQVQKVEVSYTRNIEKILAGLTSPLDVTHTVHPDEVAACLEQWRPAILKEVAGIEGAIEKLHPGTEARKKWLNTPGVQRLPTKFVFTVKPNDKADLQKPETWYKRKARLVICGNFAVNDGSQVYAETAPAEAVRAGLAMSSRNRWCIAILDVVAAFLRTPLGRSVKDPVVIAQPPRLLEVLGISAKLELWGLLKALYGLREAPMLWGSFRDDTLQDLNTPHGLKWKQGKVVTSWWSVLDTSGDIAAIVVVYVDDFMICGPREIVTELGKAVRDVWETSELTFLGPESPIRFLGMELQRESEDAEEILDRIPITKELAAIPSVSEEEDIGTVRDAQQALGYLQRTINYSMVVKWSPTGLVMFSDASYAPQGSRSHGGWVVTYGGVPIAWRSSRQSMITLSTAEAELLALLDGAVAAKSTEAMIADVGEHVESRRGGYKNKSPAGCLRHYYSGGQLVIKDIDGGLQIDWDTAGLLMILLMALGVLLIYEGVKWSMTELYNEWMPSRGSSKGCSKKVLDMMEERPVGLIRQGELRRQECLVEEKSTRGCSEEIYDRSSPRRQEVCHNEPRVLESVLEQSLQRCGRQEVKKGLKDDLSKRLGEKLSQISMSDTGPTIRQLRYVLWLYRDRDLSWKHTLRYHEIVDRNRISALIHALKSK